MKSELCVLGLLLLMGVAACVNEPEAAPETAEVTEAAVENTPESVFLAWQQAMDRYQFEEALKWSTPATSAWVRMIRRLSRETGSQPGQETVIDGIRCEVAGDTAYCFFAELNGDRLVLDSVRMVRLDSQWRVDLPDPQNPPSLQE